jgi:NTP pyrophosphatase (non-canonical NTP hydrolase)
MSINELSEKLEQVAAVYFAVSGVNFTSDQRVLKIQEEMGEFSKAYLKFTGTGRNKEGKSGAELKQDMADELADTIALCMLFAKNQDIDLEEAFARKWFSHL